MGRWVGLLVLVFCVAWTAPAAADVRRLQVNDARDPTVVLDVKKVFVAFDRGAGILDLFVELWSPAPTQVPAGTDLTVWISENPSVGGECVASGDPERAGDTYITINTLGAQPGELKATHNVKFRDTYPETPVAFNADRTLLAVRVVDELLKNANLRCLDGSSTGRGTYDPRQPEGGPDHDLIDSTWFDGFDPQDPRNRPFRLRLSAASPQRLVRVGSGQYRNLRLGVKCTLDCTVRITGYASQPATGRRIRGLTLIANDKVREGEDALFGFNLTATERRILARQFRRYRSVRYTAVVTVRDGAVGRVRRAKKRITLLPTKSLRRSSSRPTNTPAPRGVGGGDRDCGDFSSQAAAQAYFNGRGGSASNNVDGLDGDHDGIACEALP